MKHEFYVGDYVETKGGLIGYINTMNLNGTNGEVVWTYNGTKISIGVNFEQLINDCVRIGQYDFTKKKDNEITLLSEKYTKSFPLYKEITNGTSSEQYSIDLGAINKKINEIIDAVNELRDKDGQD